MGTTNQKGRSYKYLQALDPKIYRALRARAKPLGITVQELLRVKVIPEFLFGKVQLNAQLVASLMKEQNNGHSRKVSRNRHLPSAAR